QMPPRFMFAFVVAAACAGFVPAVIAVPAPPPDPLRAALDGLHASADIRDSLSALADSASGPSRQFLEELIWQRALEVESGMTEAAERLHARLERGPDDPAARA